MTPFFYYLTLAALVAVFGAAGIHYTRSTLRLLSPDDASCNDAFLERGIGAVHFPLALLYCGLALLFLGFAIFMPPPPVRISFLQPPASLAGVFLSYCQITDFA